jgi:AcrR family transcriptional regulator
MARPSPAAPARAPRKPRASTSAAPRTKPSAVRREDLLRAGEAVFLAKGMAAASIDEIAAAAEVAKGTFYLYFASKDELVDALRERWIRRIDERIRHFEAKAAPGDWRARMDAWIEGGVRGYFEEYAIHDVLFHGVQHHPVREQDSLLGNPVLADLAAFLGEGARAGAWQLDDAEFTAVMLFHALHGAVDCAIATERRVDRRRLIARLQAFFRRALGPERPR